MANDQTDKKVKGAAKYPPYVNAYGSIPKLFLEICKASVPPKFTQDFMETVLELKSSSHRALVPLLKKLGFIDAANVPTDVYKNYRDEELRRSVMAGQVRSAYSDLYKANEYAHSLKKEELQSKLRALIGAAEDDPVIPSVVATFLELTKLLKPLIEDDSGRNVRIRPKIVVEISYEEIQKSPTYNSGYALRFPRVVRLRDDKGPKQADSIADVERLYRQQK